MGNNSWERCQYVSPQGEECDVWFQVDGKGHLCPKYHRNLSVTENKENFISLMNSERDLCYKMSNEDLEQHITSLEAKIEEFLQTERTKLASARAVRAERYQKMSAEERKELQKIKVSDPNGKKPTAKSREDKSTKMANKLGVSRNDLLTMDVDQLMARFNKAKGNDEASKSTA